MDTLDSSSSTSLILICLFCKKMYQAFKYNRLIKMIQTRKVATGEKSAVKKSLAYKKCNIRTCTTYDFKNILTSIRSIRIYCIFGLNLQ